MRRLLLGLAVLLGLVALLGTGVAFGCVSFGPPSTRDAFRGRPEPVLTSFVPGDGRAIAAAETGNRTGPLVLFVHGTPGGWRDFAGAMADPRLAARARLVAVDRAGWGASSAGGVEPSLRAQAAALVPVLDAFRENLPAVVVGHSYGGPVAARLAMDAPERVRALVLVAASVDPALEETTWYQALGRTWLVRPLVPDALARADRELVPLRAELAEMLPGWARLTLPMLVLHGEDDALVPVANADFVVRAARAAPVRVERMPDQGHLIPWQRPDRIVASVLAALNGPRERTSDVGPPSAGGR